MLNYSSQIYPILTRDIAVLSLHNAHMEQGRASNQALGRTEAEQMFREHCVHLGDAAATEFRKLLADKLAGLVPAERSAPLPPALQSWRTAEALLQDDRRFGALPRSGRRVSASVRLHTAFVPRVQPWKGQVSRLRMRFRLHSAHTAEARPSAAVIRPQLP